MLGMIHRVGLILKHDVSDTGSRLEPNLMGLVSYSVSISGPK
jgi:hypothetical protein